MRTRYIVTYDISNPKRLRLVFRKMMGTGTHIQLSVFRCDLTRRQKESLMLELSDIIKPSEDQILIIELAPTESGVAERISFLGRPYSEAAAGPLIV